MDTPPMLAGVIGWPVSHSLSPRIHMAAAAATNVSLVYSAIPVKPGETRAALENMRMVGIRGYSVTMPHKEAVIPDLDELTPSARALGAVNHITNSSGRLVGNNTDGDGFVLGFEYADDKVIDGSVVGVIGSGGAARAIIEACYRHGAAEVRVVARSFERGCAAASLANDRGKFVQHDALSGCNIVVNATPIGMDGTEGAGAMPFDVDSLDSDTTVVDIVYNPRETPLLAAAHKRDLSIVGGVTMLVGQAAEQFTTWTGVDAPLHAMFDAVDAGER